MKSFKRFESKKIAKPNKVKGGALGRGTRKSASNASVSAELL